MSEIADIDEVDGSSSTDYLQKFGYREYDGIRISRKKRILSMIEFEVKSTWSRSTFGKVLLVIIMVLNFFVIIFGATIAERFETGYPGGRQAYIDDALNSFVANYVTLGDSSYISSGPEFFTFGGPPIGFLLLILFAIAGSGLFADDKSGKVIEVYLSRLQKKEYVAGKIGSLLVYINFFLLLPMILVVTLMLQSWSEPQFAYWFFYLRVIWFSLLFSLVIGLPILYLSSLLEKRNYVSLGFFLFYMIASIFGDIAIFSDESNEFLLLLSPDIFLSLLAFVALGDYNLGLGGESFDGINIPGAPFSLNDGAGLEYWHVYAAAFAWITLFTILLSLKINKLTTEEL